MHRGRSIYLRQKICSEVANFKSQSSLIRKTIALLFVGVAAGEEVQSLLPLVVSEKKINAQEDLLFGAYTELGAEGIDAVPAGAGNYQDLFALFAGAYSGNPSVGTFSLRGLSQDNVFGYLGTGSNALINVLLDGAPLSPASLRYLPPVLWDLERAQVLRGPQSFP